MPNLRKKIKAAKLLETLGEKGSKFIVMDEIVKELENAKSSIPSPYDERPLLAELQELKDQYEEISSALEIIGEQISNTIKELSDNVSGTLINEDDKIKKLEKDLKDTEREFFYRLSQIGGGSMNRQMKIDGTDYLTKFTDVNFISGTGITLSASTDNTNKRVNITITGTAGFSKLVPTGTINGTNRTFTFTTAPSVIVIDEEKTVAKTQRDGGVNWTGTTTITLDTNVGAPNFDIFGY